MSNFVDDDRFDGMYLNVASTAKGIEPLLDTVFSFSKRDDIISNSRIDRTEQTHFVENAKFNNNNIGLTKTCFFFLPSPSIAHIVRRKTDFFSGPPGSDNGTAAAIQKVNQVLEKHAKLYQQEQDKKKKKKSPQKSATPTQKATSQQKGDDDDVIEMSNDGEFDVSGSSRTSAVAAAAAATTIRQQSPAQATSVPTEASKPPETTASSSQEPPSNDPSTTTNNKEPPPLGNGGTVPGKYVWTQTLSELNVTIPVPDNTRGKDLNVTIAKSHLKVALRSSQKKKEGEYIVNAPLTKPIICDDSFWTVEDGNRLVLSLQKVNQMEWWDSVCQGDPTIDVKKIQPENSSLGDLDGETQKTVAKMMFDQRQKAMGLPTSEEQTKLDAIEQFKKQHPELDFSNAKIT
eukprot:scaffold834_cov123-Cylindrotheca_fusiformis.AAC.14